MCENFRFLGRYYSRSSDIGAVVVEITLRLKQKGRDV